MNGYIFTNTDGKKLAHGKYWYNDDGYNGWVFTEEEKDEILSECATWKIKPAFMQRANINLDFKTVELMGDPIQL